jgi:23S rRNA (cytidine1920-2'-O)/16S rRNA (cytidine1409-2'-O)-methyltransferase
MVITAAEELDWFAQGIVASPITGPAGNHEYVLWLGANRTEHGFDLQRLVKSTLQ